jgi:hypothetical protein
MDPMTMMSMFQGMGGGGGGGGGLDTFLSGLFGHSGRPYDDAMKQYQEWANKAQGAQDPYINAGKGAIPQFQEWLNGMKDPSGFINNLMGKYQESPWAKYQQEQALRASGNAGSAGGLLGSTPMSQFNQENARNISSQDMGNWLQNVLGINTQYGAGQSDLIHGGQNAANAMTNFYGDMGRQMGEQAYNKRRAENMDRRNIWGGAIDMMRHGLFG